MSTTGTTPTAPASARPWWARKRYVIPAAVAGVALVMACGGAPDGPSKPLAAAGAPAATGQAAPPAEPAGARYDEPKAANFRVKVKVTEKQCFGSAGCVITAKTSLGIVDKLNLDPSVTYELTYEVLGDDSGPIVGSMEITGDQYSGGDTKHFSTASSATKITARITGIEKQ